MADVRFGSGQNGTKASSSPFLSPLGTIVGDSGRLPTTSYRYFRTSSGIQQRLVPVYRFAEVGIPDSRFHNQIYRPLEDIL